MYQVGERIIYGGSGVCEVRAAGPLESVGGDRLYYTLVPLYGSGVIYAPVDGPVFNRPLLTPQELHGLLEQFSEIPAEPLAEHSLTGPLCVRAQKPRLSGSGRAHQRSL